MGGSPSKKREEEFFLYNQLHKNEGYSETKEKERSISLPSKTNIVSNSSQQKHIVPIKSNRSVTIQNYPRSQVSKTIRVPVINSSVCPQRTVFTTLQDNLNQKGTEKASISNLDISMIDFQSSIPIVHSKYPSQTNNKYQSELNSSQFSIIQQQLINQPNPVIIAPIQQKSNASTPQKQVPKIVHQNIRNPQENLQKVSPFRPIQKVVIYESNSNTSSANKQGIFTKLNTSLTQLSPKQTIKKSSNAGLICNQLKINSYLTPQSKDMDFQNSIRTNTSNNFLSENIRVLDLLYKNTGIIPLNSVSRNQSTIGESVGDNNSTVQSAFQNCSQYFTQNNTSGRQGQQNHTLNNNSVLNNEEKFNGNNTQKENILIVDKSPNTTSAGFVNSEFQDETSLKETPSSSNQQKQSKQQNNIKNSSNNMKDIFQNSQLIQKSSTLTTKENIQLTQNNQQQNDQNLLYINQQNNLRFNNYFSNDLTQKKQIHENSLNEKSLIQLEKEKKIQIQITKEIDQASTIDSNQIYSIHSPNIKKIINQNDEVLQDDQISLIYSATENQKKSGNSIFQHQAINHNSNNNFAKYNGIFSSDQQQNQVDNNNVSNMVFQNSSQCMNNSNQMLMNIRMNNFQKERQLVVKLEDIYKQMDTSESKQQENNKVLQNQIIYNQNPSQKNQINQGHQFEPISNYQRSLSQSVFSVSAMRASQTNLKGDEYFQTNNSFIMSSSKNNYPGLVTTSVTQLPIIQQNYYPTTIKKINPISENQYFYSNQPQSNLRSQSVNQTISIQNTVSQFDSVKTDSKERYYSVDSTSLKKDGVFQLKDNVQYLNDQSLQNSNKILSTQPILQTLQLAANQIQVSLQTQKINNTPILPITYQTSYHQPQNLNKQIYLQHKIQPTQFINISQEKQIQNEQIYLNKNNTMPAYYNEQRNTSNQLFVQNLLNQTNEVQLQKYDERNALIQNIKEQVQSAYIPMSSSSIKSFQPLKNHTDSFPNIKSCELQNNIIKSSEFDQEARFQSPHIDIQSILKTITLEDISKQENNNINQVVNKLNPINKSIQPIQQKELFQGNTLKIKQKDIYSSMESIGATSSIAKEQTSSCEEFKKPIYSNNQEQSVLQYQNQQINQNSKCFYKNQVRVQEPKQEQIKQFGLDNNPKEVSLNLQEHINVKLDQINIQNDQNYNSLNKINTLQSTKSYKAATNSNYQSTNNVLHNTTVDFQLTRSDDEIVQNNQNTITDNENDEGIKQHLIHSLPKKKLNPQDNIQIYLNFNSECSDYSSIQSDYNDKISNQMPQPMKELSKTRQLNNPLINNHAKNINKNNVDNSFHKNIANNSLNIYEDNQLNKNEKNQTQNIQIDQHNFQISEHNKQQYYQQISINNQLKNSLNNLQANSQINSLNNSQNNSSRQRSNNHSQRIPKYKVYEQNIQNKEQEIKKEWTNDTQINKMIQNELNCITKDTYSSENKINDNGKLCELALLEQQDNCKKTLLTHQNIIDMEDQRKSPKEFDKEINDHSSQKIFDKKRFLTQNDQEEEEDSINNYKEAINSIQEQSVNSHNGGVQNSNQFHLSKQQIFSSVNSYNLHNSTIIKKVNNKFQALSSLSQNIPSDIEKEINKGNNMKDINVENEVSDGEIYFKYCKKTSVLIPLSYQKMERLIQEKKENNSQKQQYYFKLNDNKKKPKNNNNKSFQENISKYNGPLNSSQERRQSLSINPYTNRPQDTSFSNLYNKQYAFIKNNSNLYTDVLERYSSYINKRAREQKTQLQQNQSKKNNNKDYQTVQVKKNNLRV